MDIHFLDCFCTKDKHSGNRAAVIINFGGEHQEKQIIATKLNLPVTVFLSSINDTNPTLEFFYPHYQTPLCLHGTIAAAKVLFLKSNRKIVDFSISFGKEHLTVSEQNDSVFVTVTKKDIPNADIDISNVCAMLNTTSAVFHASLPLQIASVGSPKLLIPVNNYDDLMTLTPNFLQIVDWSIKTKVNGLYVYTQLEETLFSTRAFNPKTGKNEDSATGVASAALSLKLGKSILVKQGEAIGSPCQIFNTYIDSNTVSVGGRVNYL